MRPPRYEELIADSIEARLESVHTTEPGWVLDYDPTSKTCTAQSAIAQPYIREDGERAAQIKPPSRNARVAFPGGIVFRLEPGDPVTIHYCSAALDNWSPDKNKAHDPGDERRHSLSDAIVVPLGKATETPDRNEVIVEYDSVLLGKKGLTGTRSPVVRKTDLEDLSSALFTLAATLTGAIPPMLEAAAAITGLKEALDVIIAAMSTNVEAT